MKKIIFVSLPIFAFILLGCGLFNGEENDYDAVKDPSEIEEGENITLTGRVWYYFDGDLFFTLEDKDEHYTIFISSNEDISIGEYLQAEGTWDKTNDALVAENIKKLSEEEKMTYLRSRHPVLEIEILEYPKIVAHTCATPKFKLKLTNTGTNTVTHEDIHTYEYDYAFYYFFDEDWHRANADREDYSQVAGQIQEDELSLIGFLSNQGFMHFEDIKPGGSREVEYWAGGEITKNELGTAGLPNILGNQQKGETNISFGWALKNNYDPIFLFKTDSVGVELLNENCEM